MSTAPARPVVSPLPRSVARSLAWGRRYLAVSPDHFRVDYAINPFMDPASPEGRPDPVRTRAQWDAMVAAVEAAGARVEVLPQLAEAPDMVYAMNLGLAVERPDGTPHVVLSHMRHPERRMETPVAAAWFRDHGATVQQVGAEGVGAHLEAGDAFAWRGDLVVGHGPRTEELALKHLATELEVTVHGVRIAHPGMYHLDLAFCPLDSERAMVCPDAFDPESAAALLALVPDPLVLSEEEAMTFCANSVVVGRTVIGPAFPDRVRARLKEWGFEVVAVDMGELHKGGGSVRCLTNPLDVRLGRDLAHVPGGRVLLP